MFNWVEILGFRCVSKPIKEGTSFVLHAISKKENNQVEPWLHNGSIATEALHI